MNLFRSESTDDLPQIAGAFLQKYPEPGVFLLRGEMGAGKTTFIRALCELMGADSVSSPTFSLVNEYRSAGGHTIYHFDLYRIRNVEEALDFGVEEYLASDAYLFIEWPDVLLPILGNDYHIIEIKDDKGVRNISF